MCAAREGHNPLLVDVKEAPLSFNRTFQAYFASKQLAVARQDARRNGIRVATDLRIGNARDEIISGSLEFEGSHKRRVKIAIAGYPRLFSGVEKKHPKYWRCSWAPEAQIIMSPTQVGRFLALGETIVRTAPASTLQPSSVHHRPSPSPSCCSTTSGMYFPAISLHYFQSPLPHLGYEKPPLT